jgi:uncharacterized DUF497 family protein
MQVSYEFHGQTFEWDSKKAASNLRKYSVSFETACEVFFDPFVCLMEAAGSDETRDAAVGFTESSKLLFVVHSIRDRERIRIISARVATAHEWRDYEGE